MNQEPVVVEFESPDSNFLKHHFIGASLDDILADTKQGKGFGHIHFSSYRIISLEEAKKLNLGFFEDGYKSITNKECKSYKLMPTEKK
jgi:hypothetical protein